MFVQNWIQIQANIEKNHLREKLFQTPYLQDSEEMCSLFSFAMMQRCKGLLRKMCTQLKCIAGWGKKKYWIAFKKGNELNFSKFGN